jgi:CRP-like cAMP-binding protein
MAAFRSNTMLGTDVLQHALANENNHSDQVNRAAASLQGHRDWVYDEATVARIDKSKRKGASGHRVSFIGLPTDKSATMVRSQSAKLVPKSMQNTSNHTQSDEDLFEEQATIGHDIEPTPVGQSGDNQGIERHGTIVKHLNTRARTAPMIPDAPLAHKHRDSDIVPSRFLLYPDTTFRSGWDALVVALLLWTGIMVPVRLSFVRSASTELSIIELIIDCLFAVDIVLNFLTTFEVRPGIYEKSLKKVAKKYFFGWFTIDLVATFPFYLFEDSSYNRLSRLSRLPRIFKLLRLLRILKLLRLHQLNGYIERIMQAVSVNSGLIRFLRSGFWMLLVVHMTACMWYYVAVEDGLHAETWVARENVINAPTGTLYLASVYWSFSTITTVGYGDINASTDLEYGISIIAMLLGVSFYSYAIGNMAAIMTNSDSRANALREQLDTLNAWMRDTHMPVEMQERLRAFIKFKHENSTVVSYSQDQLLRDLSPQLRTESLNYIHRDVIAKIPWFQNKRPEFIAHFVSLVQPIAFGAGDYVIRQGELGSDMFFLVHGRAQTTFKRTARRVGDDVSQKNTQSTLRAMRAFSISRADSGFANTDAAEEHAMTQLIEGSYFGEISLLQVAHRPMSVRAVTDCHMLMLSRADLLDVLRQYPGVGRELRNFAARRYQAWIQKCSKFNQNSSDQSKPAYRFSALPDASQNDEESSLSVSLAAANKAVTDAVSQMEYDSKACTPESGTSATSRRGLNLFRSKRVVASHDEKHNLCVTEPDNNNRRLSPERSSQEPIIDEMGNVLLDSVALPDRKGIGSTPEFPNVSPAVSECSSESGSLVHARSHSDIMNLAEPTSVHESTHLRSRSQDPNAVPGPSAIHVPHPPRAIQPNSRRSSTMSNASTASSASSNSPRSKARSFMTHRQMSQRLHEVHRARSDSVSSVVNRSGISASEAQPFSSSKTQDEFDRVSKLASLCDTQQGTLQRRIKELRRHVEQLKTTRS